MKIMGVVSGGKFGGEFPIRFDYLDTMDGGIFRQVHPQTTYIKENFNENYHQERCTILSIAKKVGGSIRFEKRRKR